ncbi:hypothetical protein EI42_02748 [Thermosporothrix hazakensis]|jgi:hypothetical protein|uniref:Uncharacterized protein n=1 Tax=Thermosporothrix hazakensis TaxID=644383 RepID=A0A326UFS9_THEHA|nr:hypothetical protein EI42_02748 [Thermosporothrix hazakensis]
MLITCDEKPFLIISHLAEIEFQKWCILSLVLLRSFPSYS